MRRLRGIIPFVLIALAGGTLWLLLGRESIEEGRCRLVRQKADPSSQLMGLAWQFLQPLEGKPAGLQSPPAGFNRPCYYQIKSGDRLIPVAMDLGENPNLCLDTNGDGILTHETRFTARHISETKTSSSSWRFGPISLRCPDSPGNGESRFYAYGYRTDTPGPLSILPVFYRSGRLRLEGRTYRVALVDGDCDGRFSSLPALPLVERPWRLPACDVFAIDLNRNGAFEISLSARSEVMPLGQLVQVGGNYYTIDVPSDGTSLTLSQTEPQLGTLVLESGDAAVELKLWSDAADQYLAPGHQWQLPVGKYMATYAALEQKDASGVRTLPARSSSATPHLGPLDFFVIEPGEVTSVKIGPPFTIKTDVQPADPGNITIRAVLAGCAGEEYQMGWRQDGAASPGPAFKIVDEKGTVLAAGKFEYG